MKIVDSLLNADLSGFKKIAVLIPTKMKDPKSFTEMVLKDYYKYNIFL